MEPQTTVNDVNAKILDQLERLESGIREIREEMSRHRGMLEKLNTASDSLLHVQLLEKMAPGLLERLLPRVSGDMLDSFDPFIGLGRAYSSMKTRRAAGRMLMSLAVTLTSPPFALTEELMREAKRVGGRDSYIYGVFLSQSRYRGNYGWERLLPECEAFESFNEWTRENRHAWAVCIECHGKLGHDEKVGELLRSYADHYNLELLEDVPYAAYYARENGFINERTALAAALVDEIETNNRNRELERLLTGKSVAVVGGGAYERGKGKGPEIDGHDIVVRIKYLPQDAYAADYGRKTDILCVLPGRIGLSAPDFDKIGSIHADNITGVDNILLPYDLSRRFFDYAAIEKIMRGVSRFGTRILAPSRDFCSDLIRPFSYRAFTIGFLAILYIKALKPELSRDDLYGFYHKEPKGYNGEYLWHNPAMAMDPIDSHHDFDQEKECFDLVFGGTSP